MILENSINETLSKHICNKPAFLKLSLPPRRSYAKYLTHVMFLRSKPATNNFNTSAEAPKAAGSSSIRCFLTVLQTAANTVGSFNAELTCSKSLKACRASSFFAYRVRDRNDRMGRSPGSFPWNWDGQGKPEASPANKKKLVPSTAATL